MNNRCNLCKCCNKTYEHTDMRDFDNKAHCTYLDTDITEFIIKDINIASLLIKSIKIYLSLMLRN